MQMKETKRRIEFYSLYDHTGIEKHLEKMAAKGWMLKDIGTHMWKYRRIEPQSLSFSVVYYPKKVINDEMTADRQSFIDSCTVAGWKFVMSHGRLHVFCNESENPVPIESDAKTQVESIHGFAKSEIICSNLIVLFLALGFMVWFIYRVNKEPVETLSDDMEMFLIFPFSILLSVWSIIKYLVWYKKAKSAAEDGFFTETKRIFAFDNFFYPIWLLGGFVKIYTFLSPSRMLFWAVVALFAVLLLFLFKLIRRTYEKSEISLSAKRTMNVIIGAVLIAGFIAGSVGIHTLFPKRSETVIDKSKGYTRTYQVYYDKDLPFDMEDLIDAGGFVSKYKTREWLGLVNIMKTEQFVPGGENITCDIYYINYAPLYDACEKEIKDIFENQYVETDAAPWNANKVSRIRYDYGFGNRFVVCWDGIIAELAFSWSPTDEQIATVSEKIMNSEM